MTDRSSAIVELSEADAPKIEAANRIVINFPDDHDINGMKIEMINLTSEQIMVAVYYLTRSANQLSDAKQMEQAMRQREIASIAAEIRKGH